MRFCLECGTSLPDDPLVIDVHETAKPEQSGVKTASYERSVETQVGSRFNAPRNFANVPPSQSKSGGKIFLVLGGIALLFLLFLTAGAAILISNWGEIARMFDDPQPTPQPTRAVDEPTPDADPSVLPSVQPTSFPTATPRVKPSPKSKTDARTKFDKVWVDFNVKEKGRMGMRIHTKFSVLNMKGVKSYLAIYFQKKDGTELMSNDPDFRSRNGNLALFQLLRPAYANTIYKDIELFMPYAELNLDRGRHDLKLDIDLISENGELIEHMGYYEFWYEENK